MRQATGRSQSQVLHHLVADAVARHATSQEAARPPALPPAEPGARGAKPTLRRTPAEAAALARHAQAVGMSGQQWLLALARVQLFEAPQFNLAEIEAVHAANRELRAIGRNLNQIVYAMNLSDGGALDQVGEFDVAELARAIDAQARRLSALADQALNRWVP